MVATARSRWVAVQESYQAARWRVMALELVERDNKGKRVFHHSGGNWIYGSRARESTRQSR
jgi:hypothetical protein